MLVQNVSNSTSGQDGHLLLLGPPVVAIDSFWITASGGPGASVCLRYDPEALNFQPLQVSVLLSGTTLYSFHSDQITPFTNRYWLVTFGDLPGSTSGTATTPEPGPC